MHDWYKSMALLLIIILFVFFIWQFYVLKKYNIGYPAINVNSNLSQISIGKESIRFSDIKFINIVEMEQPALIERALSKGASYVHLSTIEIYLKNDTMIPVKCNSKHTVKNLINSLQGYAEIHYDSDVYDGADYVEICKIAVIIICIILLLFVLLGFVTTRPY